MNKWGLKSLQGSFARANVSGSFAEPHAPQKVAGEGSFSVIAQGVVCGLLDEGRMSKHCSHWPLLGASFDFRIEGSFPSVEGTSDYFLFCLSFLFLPFISKLTFHAFTQIQSRLILLKP